MFSKARPGGIATHIFFFFLFLVVPILVFPRPPGMPFFSLGRAFLQDSVANCMLLVFFYLNYYIFIPRFYFQHKYLAYFGWVILSLAIAFELPHLLITDLRHLAGNKEVSETVRKLALKMFKQKLESGSKRS